MPAPTSTPPAGGRRGNPRQPRRERASSTPPAGTTVVGRARRATRDDGRIAVLDAGPGPGAGEEERVFDRFVRGSSRAAAPARQRPRASTIVRGARPALGRRGDHRQPARGRRRAGRRPPAAPPSACPAADAPPMTGHYRHGGPMTPRCRRILATPRRCSASVAALGIGLGRQRHLRRQHRPVGAAAARGRCSWPPRRQPGDDGGGATRTTTTIAPPTSQREAPPTSTGRHGRRRPRRRRPRPRPATTTAAAPRAAARRAAARAGGGDSGGSGRGRGRGRGGDD